jgi:predicted peptidase
MFPHVFHEGALQYLLSIPPPPASGRPPLLCFLHGYDEGAPADIGEALMRHGPLRANQNAHATDTFLIVAPQLPTRGDLWHRSAGAVRHIVARMQQQYGGDPARSYLTGFSFGGNGVFDLALLQPDIWSALWAVDPTRVPAADPLRPVWLSFGEVARSGKARFIRALDLKPGPPVGGADRVYLDQGADHVGSATLAYQDCRIYDWLLSKTR